MKPFEIGQRVYMIANEENQGVILEVKEEDLLVEFDHVDSWISGDLVAVVNEDVVHLCRVKKINELKKELQVLEEQHIDYLYKKHGVNGDSDLLDRVKVLWNARKPVEAVKLIRSEKSLSLKESKDFYDRLVNEWSHQ